jgi:hypothetical protein
MTSSFTAALAGLADQRLRAGGRQQQRDLEVGGGLGEAVAQRHRSADDCCRRDGGAADLATRKTIVVGHLTLPANLLPGL